MGKEPSSEGKSTGKRLAKGENRILQGKEMQYTLSGGPLKGEVEGTT